MVDQVAGVESAQLTVDYAQGLLALNPAPQPGPDATDGKISVTGMLSVQPAVASKATAAPLADQYGAWQQLLQDVLLRAPATSGQASSEPVIVSGAAPAATQTFSIERHDWVNAFVNRFGSTPAANPNAGLRVTLPVPAQAVRTVSLLRAL